MFDAGIRFDDEDMENAEVVDGVPIPLLEDGWSKGGLDSPATLGIDGNIWLYWIGG